MIVMDIPPETFEPPAIVQPVRKKRRSRSDRQGTVTTGIVVGTILILSDRTECRVTHIDQNGQAWCVPVNQ